MIEKKNALLLIVTTLLLTACGGGGGGKSSTTTGKVVDGYIKNAIVFCDADADEDGQNVSEEVVTTDSAGVFTFSSACNGSVVAKGGTDIATGLPLKNVLKGPSGTSVVTILTTLITKSMPKAQVLAFVGLPTGTNLLTLDPAATNADGSLQNPSLMQKTLAMQQVVLQITNALGALANDSTVPASQAISEEVAKAVIAIALANPNDSLIDSNGAVSSAVVSNIIQKAMSDVVESSNPSLTGIKTTIGAYSPVSVANAISAAISTQAHELAIASHSDSLTASLQSSPIIANATIQIAALLTTAQADKVDMSQFGADLASFVAAIIAGDSAGQSQAAADAAAAVGAQSANAGVTVNFNPNKLSTPTDYLSIANDTITINGTNFTLTQFHNGLSFVGASQASLDTVGFTFNVVGKPIPANTNGVSTTTVALGLELADANGRLAQIVLNQVNVTIDSNNKISIDVPANAVAYAYGRTAAGASANLTLTNVGANTISVVNNLVSFNMGLLFGKIANALQGDSAAQAVFSSLQNIKGTFNTKIVMSTLDLRHQDATSAPGLSLSVIGSGQLPLSGLGEQGIVTIQ